MRHDLRPVVTAATGARGRTVAGLRRAVPLLVLFAGALGSAALTLRAGQRNPSALLRGLFVAWVLLPFLALGWATVASHRRGAPLGAVRHSVIVLLTLGSLGVYATVVFGAPRAKGAPAFLLVPAASWLLMGAAGALRAAMLPSRSPSRRSVALRGHGR